MINYGKQWIDESDIRAVVGALKSDFLTQGPRVGEFERTICRYTGAKYAVAVSSGTAALHLACLAAGLKKGSEAITTPITFLATPNSILYTGATPVFADINRETINIDPREIEKKATVKTKAVLPIHFAGFPCNMPMIYKIARAKGLKIIEDACHALGAQYKHGSEWIKVGSCKHSDMTAFSFHPVKNITTGEGGAITTNSKTLYEKLLILRTHGVVRKEQAQKREGGWYYEMKELGFNYRITEFQCALGIAQFEKLDDFIWKRRKIAKIYEREFAGNDFFDLPPESNSAKSAWHLYVIRLKDRHVDQRRQFFEKLRKSGIGAQVHYIPVHTQPYYQKHLGYRRGDYPISEDYYKRALTLPLYPKIKKGEVGTVVQTIKKLIDFYKR